jgi:hypothetical protein
MATLNIGGKRVTVDDSFLTMTPEQQAATVEEIAGSLGGGAAQAPARQQPAPTGPGALTASTIGARQGLTMNFGDELMAGLTTPIEMAIGAYKGTDAGKGFGQRISDAYGRGLEQERALQRQAQEQNPAAYGVGNVAGGLTTSGQLLKGGATLLKGGGSAGSMIGRGAAEGALYGAAAGAGEGEGWEDRATKALVSGGVGGATGGALGAVGSALAGRNSRSAVPSIDDLRAAKDAAYRAVDNAGVMFTPNAVDRINQKIVTDLTNIGFSPRLQPGAAVVLDEIQKLAGQNVTLTGLDTVRKIAGGAYIPGNKSNNSAVSKIIEAIDGVVQSPQASDILAGNAVTAGQTLAEARRLASQVFKQEKIADAVVRAERQAASTGSGGNADNATRQKLRSILEKGRGWSDAEKEALETAIRGTRAQNLARLVGKLSPSGNGLSMMLNLGAAGQTAGASLPITALGVGAKAIADRATSGNVKVIDALIRSGGAMPARQLTAKQRALIEALTRESGPTQTTQR